LLVPNPANNARLGLLFSSVSNFFIAWFEPDTEPAFMLSECQA
jgi:hypothetical protein